MIQPNNNNISATSYDPSCKDPTTSTPKTRQATLDSNKSDKAIVRRHPQNRNRTLSGISSIRSQKSAKSYRSYWKRNRLPWVLVSSPLARRTMQTTQSMISIIVPSLINSLSDTEILQEIYHRAQNDASNQRTLQSFWDKYCDWLKICKNLEDSQSQIEYWTAKDEFNKLNKHLRDHDREPIPKMKFQPPMPENVEYLS